MRPRQSLEDKVRSLTRDDLNCFATIVGWLHNTAPSALFGPFSAFEQSAQGPLQQIWTQLRNLPDDKVLRPLRSRLLAVAVDNAREVRFPGNHNLTKPIEDGLYDLIRGPKEETDPVEERNTRNHLKKLCATGRKLRFLIDAFGIGILLVIPSDAISTRQYVSVD